MQFKYVEYKQCENIVRGHADNQIVDMYCELFKYYKFQYEC